MSDPASLRTALQPDDDLVARRKSRRGALLTGGVLVGLIALIVLLTPMQDDAGDRRLTTEKFGANNARLLHDLSARLGWQVERSRARLVGPLDSTKTYAVFGGPTPMRGAERAALLDAVRRGAGLLIAPQASGELALFDSLGISSGPNGILMTSSLGTCPPTLDASAIPVRSWMITFATDSARRHDDSTARTGPSNVRALIQSNVRPPSDDNGERTVDDTSHGAAFVPRPSLIAFRYGHGRVVAAADPDLFRTDQLRSCTAGTALGVTRGLEYLAQGESRRLEFAEYYQGISDDGPSVVLQEWLVGSHPGRAVLSLLCAAVVLILARARRTLAPVMRVRDERRSALEHVEALATAWRAVRGTKTVARMLSRGIRRRHAAGRWRTLDDAEFLSALSARHPAIADDVARLTRAIDTPESPADLPALRQAAARIDAECLTP